jgi:hypothetical protein
VNGSLVLASGSLACEDALAHEPANEAELAMVAQAARTVVVTVPQPMVDPPVMTVEELADFLRVSRGWIAI